MEPREVIKAIRTKKGVSQKSIAEKVGITQQALALIEKGDRKLDTSLFLDILLAFDISPKDYEEIIFGLLQDKCKDFVQGLNFDSDAILFHFYELNELGREEAIKRVAELTEIPRYTKSDNE